MRCQSGLCHLQSWVQAHRIKSRSPNRWIFSFAGEFSDFFPLTFFLKVFPDFDCWRSGVLFANLCFAGEPACYLGGCTDTGRFRDVESALFLPAFFLSGSPGWHFCGVSSSARGR